MIVKVEETDRCITAHTITEGVCKFWFYNKVIECDKHSFQRAVKSNSQDDLCSKCVIEKLQKWINKDTTDK